MGMQELWGGCARGREGLDHRLPSRFQGQREVGLGPPMMLTCHTTQGTPSLRSDSGDEQLEGEEVPWALLGAALSLGTGSLPSGLQDEAPQAPGPLPFSSPGGRLYRDQ